MLRVAVGMGMRVRVMTSRLLRVGGLMRPPVLLRVAGLGLAVGVRMRVATTGAVGVGMRALLLL